MSFTITGDRDDVAASLEAAERFAAHGGSNQTLTMLHLHHSTERDENYVEASDQRMSMRTHFWGTFDEDEVDVLVHPKLRRAVEGLAEGAVTLAKQGGATLLVTGKGKARYEVPCLTTEYPNAFPGLDAVDWDDVTPVDAKEAFDAMSRGTRYVAKKDGNPTITGVNLRVVEGKLAVDATDSQRCYQERVALPGGGFPFGENEVILPVRMVNELVKLFPSGEVLLKADDHRFFASDSSHVTTFMSQRIGGKYPDMDSIAKEGDYKVGFVAPRAELLAALQRIEAMVGKKPVKLDVKAGELALSAKSDEGSAEEWVTLPHGGEPIVIGFNVEHLASGLHAFDADAVLLRYVSPQRPAVLTADGEDRRFVVIPVRV